VGGVGGPAPTGPPTLRTPRPAQSAGVVIRTGV